MTKASSSTINPGEAAHFGALAADWWDPKGSSAMLHRLNPVRLAYIRDAIDLHFHCDSSLLKPLAGKKALDVGCGAGGVATELLARGYRVEGVSPSPLLTEAAHKQAGDDFKIIGEQVVKSVFQDGTGLGAAYRHDPYGPVHEPSEFFHQDIGNCMFRSGFADLHTLSLSCLRRFPGQQQVSR